MKKIIVALAAVAMTAGFVAKSDVCNTQCNKPQPCDSAFTAPCPPKFCPFEGLNLTDTQKQQLKELSEKQKQARTEAKKEKAERKAEKKADRKALKRARLDEIKNILTPEQYVTFLENNYLNGDASKIQPRDAKKVSKADPRGERTQGPAADKMPRDKKGPKPEKVQK